MFRPKSKVIFYKYRPFLLKIQRRAAGISRPKRGLRKKELHGPVGSRAVPFQTNDFYQIYRYRAATSSMVGLRGLVAVQVSFMAASAIAST